MLEIETLAIPSVKLVRPKKHGDSRGFFSETWNRTVFADAGLDLDFVQDNHSYSAQAGVLRGLHYQKPPFAQDKLVRCTRGAIYDVAVDIRTGSPTYGQYVAAEISAENWTQILVPKGFAHGFLTLQPDTEVFYKVTDFYSQPHDASIAWNDPDLAINWPLDGRTPILSEKDLAAPAFRESDTGMSYSPDN